MQELRLRAARARCARAQVWMLRERLLKLSAHVARSVRRVVIHLPVSFPFLNTFQQVALTLVARAGEPCLLPHNILCHGIADPRPKRSCVLNPEGVSINRATAPR
jgi:hypothetical protein